MSRRWVAIAGSLFVVLSVGQQKSAASTAEPFEVRLRIESQLSEVSSDELEGFVMSTLNDPRGWSRAGLRFVADRSSRLRVVLAPPANVDELCAPLGTESLYSCQNGPVVALNGDRWKGSFSGWDQDISAYRQYMVNHEVGHIFGQRHPKPRCPISGGRSAVMEQQTKGLEGCRGNAWPLGWEIALASQRPLKIAPLPSWQPEPVPTNLGDDPATPTVERTAVASTSVQSTPAPTTIPALSIPPADSADSTPVLVPTPSVPDTPGVPNTAESPSSAKPSTNQSGSPPFIIFAVLALVAATGLAAFVFAGARRFVRQHRRPRPRRQATSMPSGAVDLRAAAFGHPQLSACELTRGVLIAAVILPSSATVIDKSEISALLGRLVQTTVAQIGTDGAWSSGEAVGSLLATVSRDFHVSAGVLAVGKTDLRYSTIGRVGVSIDNRHARRQLLTSEGRLGRLVEPGAAVAALFGGSASTVFRTVLPIQRPDDPGADVQYASLASERKNHPFVIVTRTLESEK